MNPAVTQLYAEYLQHTDGDKAAAASLTLAAVMVEDRQPVLEPTAPPEAALSIKQAAARLAVSTRSLDHLLADQCRPQLFGLLAVRVKAMFLAAVPGVVALAFFIPPDTALPRHVRDLLELKFTFNPQLDQQTNQAVE
jgi:hypothetical protein